MNELPRVRVVNPNEGWLGTECYIEGKKIDKVKRIDFSVGVDEMPTFVFESMGILDIDMFGRIQFSFTPKTIEEAKKIIEHESKKHKIDLKISEHPACIVPYIDGEDIPFCDGIDSEYDSDSKVENVKFNPNKKAIEMHLESEDIDFSEYSKFACIVLRNELLKHEDLYNGFLASMRSAIDDKFWDSRDKNGYECSIGQDDFDEAAELMLKRIIGEE